MSGSDSEHLMVVEASLTWALHLIREMSLKVDYVAADGSKSLICRVLIEA